MALNQVNTQEQIARLLDSAPHLPALPTAVFEVVRLAGEFNSSTTQIAASVAKDQALAAKVLQLANSAYYGLPREVAAVVDAVSLLGKASVRNLALLATSQRWYDNEDARRREMLVPLWNHAVAVAVASETVADACAPGQSEEAFCAGLLHNVGKIVLTVHSPDRMAKIPEFAVKSKATIAEAERRAFGFDHTEVGYALGTRWDLPERLLNPILYHHVPSACEADRGLVNVVHVADRLAAVLATGLGSDHLLCAYDPESFHQVGLRTPQDFEKMLSSVTERTLAAKCLL